MKFRYSIAGLITVIAVCGVGFAGFRSGSETWFRWLYSATVAVLLLAAVLAKSAGRRSAFWAGFAICGAAYLILGLGVRPPVVSEEIEQEQLDPVVNPFLVTTPVITFLLTSNYPSMERIGEYGYSLAVGHLMVTVLIAAVAGVLALAIVDRRSSGTNVVATEKPAIVRRRSRWLLLLIPVLAIVGWRIQMSSPTGPYFPPLVFEQEGSLNEFVATWYGKHLKAMSEPSLWELSRNAPAVAAYRFLWLPTFDRPVCVRAEKRGTSATLVLLILDGKGGYEPGDVAVMKERKLSSAEWAEIERLTERAKFWELPTKGGESGCDGEKYIFEAVRDGRYHIVVRWSPDGSEYTDLCDYMLKLTRFKFDSNEKTPGGFR
jgi:hypothetical protein